MKKVVCDKNGNQSGIHADAHDVVNHTGDLLDQKKIQVTCRSLEESIPAPVSNDSTKLCLPLEAQFG